MTDRVERSGEKCRGQGRQRQGDDRDRQTGRPRDSACPVVDRSVVALGCCSAARSGHAVGRGQLYYSRHRTSAVQCSAAMSLRVSFSVPVLAPRQVGLSSASLPLCRRCGLSVDCVRRSVASPLSSRSGRGCHAPPLPPLTAPSLPSPALPPPPPSLRPAPPPIPAPATLQ